MRLGRRAGRRSRVGRYRLRVGGRRRRALRGRRLGSRVIFGGLGRVVFRGGGGLGRLLGRRGGRLGGDC